MPDTVAFANAEASWQVFTLLEAFSDELGGWRIMDVLGMPIVELSDALVTDLLMWRYLAGIVRRANAEKKKDKE